MCLRRNVWQHQTSYIALCLRSLYQALHMSSAYLDLNYAHCTHQRTVLSVVCNKLEVLGRK